MKSSLPRMTKSQRRRVKVITRDIGCVACRQIGVFSTADANHMLSGGNRIGHSETYPLCPWHHRGVTTLPKDAMELHLGYSLADNSRKFHKMFGTDQELLDMTNRLYEAHISNIVGGSR